VKEAAFSLTAVIQGLSEDVWWLDLCDTLCECTCMCFCKPVHGYTVTH